MNDTAGVRTFNLKWFGTLTPKQIFGLLAAFALALIMTIMGFGASCMCFGMLMIAVILYMLPRMLGIENLKLMTLVGIVFMISAILIGGLITAPGFVNSQSGNPPDNDHFTNVEYGYQDSEVKIDATLKGDIGTHEVYFVYGEVSGVGFDSIYIVFDKKELLTHTGNIIDDRLDLDPNKLYAGYLTISKTNDSGEEIPNEDTRVRLTFLTGAYDGDISSVCLYGCLIGIIYIMIAFFMIMILSNIMRGRMEKTRERMEKEGRLYPPGYGRCAQCGGIVLPGEINCRKCGAYIDRPDEMKPNKKDFFECSECGAEVPGDAKECPKCGAVFDEEETEVVHADGTIETTNESSICAECGAEVPATSSFCVKCGAKTGNGKK
ncbi:MAG: zinc ribbon domain-containing protein [Candidatus Methanoplasma sp.]|jgi:ribosomal protein L40E|nr:zinc ribbon domain-containing protein [Candidatus Methanoplasma sp.]